VSGEEKGKDVGREKDKEGIYTEDAENTEFTEQSLERGPRVDRGLLFLDGDYKQTAWR